MSRALERFRYGQRVEVIDEVSWLLGRRGSVIRVNASGVGMVKVEGGIPREQWVTIEGTVFENVTMLLPHECREVR